MRRAIMEKYILRNLIVSVKVSSKFKVQLKKKYKKIQTTRVNGIRKIKTVDKADK